MLIKLDYQFIKFTIIDELDGTEQKSIISIDRIDRIVEFNNKNKNIPKILEQAKSILFFKVNDRQFSENFRYIKESIEEIILGK